MCPPGENMGGRIPPVHPRLLSLTSGGGQNKRTELDDRRLTLYRAKVGGGQKH